MKKQLINVTLPKTGPFLTASSKESEPKTVASPAYATAAIARTTIKVNICEKRCFDSIFKNKKSAKKMIFFQKKRTNVTKLNKCSFILMI